MTEKEAILELNVQISVIESATLCNLDFNPKVDNSYLERIKDAFGIAIQSLEEIQQYRTIGTVEECKAAVERMKPKKPIQIDVDGYRYEDTYRCPTCGGNFVGTGIADFCYHCGQALDWRESEE